jgi:hypothetical protein
VSKLLNPDFASLIENYDIVVFQETKTDEFDQLLLPKDYSFRAKHRTKFPKKVGWDQYCFQKLFMYTQPIKRSASKLCIFLESFSH